MIPTLQTAAAAKFAALFDAAAQRLRSREDAFEAATKEWGVTYPEFPAPYTSYASFKNATDNRRARERRAGVGARR